MSNQINIPLKCSSCGKSLMNPDETIDNLPSIALAANIAGKTGMVFLSQVYGSYAKAFHGVENIEGSIADLSCPHCHEPFPVSQICECHAPLVALQLQVGGAIKLCTRNGCKRHSLEFENVDDAFYLFRCQDESHLA